MMFNREKSNGVNGSRARTVDYLGKPYGSEELLGWANVGRRFAELHQEIEAKDRFVKQLALTDELTGLPNRRAIEQWAARELRGAVRHNSSFWVIMADLDRLESINDAYGRDSGEAVLKKFAEILQANTSQGDICGRIGGDEFVLVVTRSKEDGVRLAIERLREQVEAQKLTFRGRDVAMTASFGMAGLHRGPHLDFGRLLVQADVALHSAKRLGRNRVEIVPAEVH